MSEFRKYIFAAIGLMAIAFTLTMAKVGNVDAQACAPISSGMVSWWPGDGNANDIQDSNHGALQNGATVAPGLVGQAFSFDGIAGFVHVPNSASLTISDEFTIEFWFSPAVTITPSTPTSPGFFSKGSFDSIDLANNDGRLEVRGPVPRPFSTTNTWLAGSWYHIAVTFDSASYEIYVNGILEGGVASAYSILNNGNDVALGAISGFPTSNVTFNGLVDEVSIYNRALAPSETQAIFNAGSAGKCKSTAGEFTINVTAFIPGNNMNAFPRSCVSRPGAAPILRPLFVKTDDRWFDPNATTYRARHITTVIPDENVDPDGIKEGTGALPLTQATKLYARDALPVIDQDDDDGVLGDCSLLHAIEFPLVNNAQITPFRIGTKQVRVRLRGDVGTGAAFGLGLVADISWDVTLEIDTSGTSPRVTIQGRHDGFPAYEVYVNNQEIYRHNPGSPPYNLSHLLKLFPPMEVSIPPREKIIQ